MRLLIKITNDFIVLASIQEAGLLRLDPCPAFSSIQTYFAAPP
jgi:hypothetical protein